ncbi:hypothetical protein N0V84_012640 [Fusarium piperis]|uniref:Protein kinase domain-containing protein n=1 Tax=Fusarium piperis TaxID=1435070 RepID=A0A9W8W2K2_9HYPO|nr:hypothetical protein N0V84_012640 [Fusarium piperis]
MTLMAGLGWTYDTLLQYMDQFPDRRDRLNPSIKHLLDSCPGSSIYGLGGHSVVIQPCPGVMAKICLEKGDERLLQEQQILKLLDQAECPYIIQSFLQGTDIIFFELLENGSLHHRLSLVNTDKPIRRWMLQLSLAVASIESIGYAHADINPQNILFDSHDNLRLIDFDHSLKAGEDVDVGYEPYVRQRREVLGGYFGVAGPVPEQFALGSVFWYMKYGSEVYSELEGSERVDRLLDGIFPDINEQDPIDNIIRQCWNGRYPRVADLVEDVKLLVDAQDYPQMTIDKREQGERRRLSEQLYAGIQRAEDVVVKG